MISDVVAGYESKGRFGSAETFSMKWRQIMIATVTKHSAACIVIASAAALTAPAAANITTLQFDITEAPLGFFGVQYSADYITSVDEIAGGTIQSVRFHLEYDSTVAPNPLADAATLGIDFQPPAGDLPILTVTGADLGWSGTGQFIGDFEIDGLDLAVLDFPPDAEFALWFMRVFNTNNDAPVLGGQLANSYIQVDVAAVPGPGAVVILLAVPMVTRRRHRRA